MVSLYCQTVPALFKVSFLILMSLPGPNILFSAVRRPPVCTTPLMRKSRYHGSCLASCLVWTLSVARTGAPLPASRMTESVLSFSALTQGQDTVCPTGLQRRAPGVVTTRCHCHSPSFDSTSNAPYLLMFRPWLCTEPWM